MLSIGEKAGIISHTPAQALAEELPQGTRALLQFSLALLGVKREGVAFFCLLG